MTLKRAAFLGTSGGVSFAKNGFDVGLQKIGMNTGNAIFQYAMWSSTKNPKGTVDLGVDPAFIKENYDLLVIPAANQVNPNWDLGNWSKFVEDIDLPCVVVGLGAQANIEDGPNLDLKDGTIRFLKNISERTSSIGVRGQFTQDVLEKFGITNTEITGCPSQMINKSVSGKAIQDKIDKIKEEGVKNAVYLVGTLEEYARASEKQIAILAAQTRHRTLFQTDSRFLNFIFDGTVSPETKSFFGWVQQFLLPSRNYENFESYLRDKGIFYSSAIAWIDAMKKVDLSFGMRIHGAIASIQAGNLGVCVAFDSRTHELSSTMGVPYVKTSDLEKYTTIKDFIGGVVFDADSFDKKRSTLVSRIEKIMSDGGIKIQ